MTITLTEPQAQLKKLLEEPYGQSRSDDKERAKMLFSILNQPDISEETRASVRDELVQMHVSLVEYLAKKFKNRGEMLQDLIQVGTIGLIKAVDRFDTEYGVEFSTFATPTIVGEIKRHFRDKGWAVRMPRRLQELKLSLTRAKGKLTQDLGRSPTVAEIAKYLDISEEEVLEGIESSNAYSAISLDGPEGDGENTGSITDTLGSEDVGLSDVENRESLRPLLAKLHSREKNILVMRFFKDMTQSQIAEELGISQMHVSRILTRTLVKLRNELKEV